MTKMCQLYPPPGQEEPICDAGSDISGASGNTCSEEYSRTCPWAQETLRNQLKKQEEIYGQVYEHWV